MATFEINLTREYDIIGYGYSGGASTPYMTSDWFKVGRQGSNSGAYSKGVITIKNPAFKDLQGKGYKINSAVLKAWSYDRGNEWSTEVPIQVDGCTNEEATLNTTYNTLPTANVTGVISEVSGWNVYNSFDITNVIQAICDNGNNTATLLLYQTTTNYNMAKAYYVTNTAHPIILTIDYDIPENVGVPGNVTLDKTQTNQSAVLSWTQGTNGYLNTVTGYQIEYNDSEGGEWEYLNTVSASVTNINVQPPAKGTQRKFRVRTIGTAGELYYSNWVECPQTLRLSASGKIYINNEWLNVSNQKVYINGNWKNIINKKIIKNGIWKNTI